MATHTQHECDSPHSQRPLHPTRLTHYFVSKCGADGTLADVVNEMRRAALTNPPTYKNMHHQTECRQPDAWQEHTMPEAQHSTLIRHTNAAVDATQAHTNAYSHQAANKATTALLAPTPS